VQTEIASYGYVISADGPPNGNGGAQSRVQDSRDSIDWAIKGGASKYGTIDLDNITSAGHSCGGLEAMSVAYHDTRVKRIILFNIAIFQDERRYLLQEIKVSRPGPWSTIKVFQQLT
jgi:esterase/lipase